MKEYPRGVWLDPRKNLPVVFENEAGIETSNPVLIVDKNNCLWLAFWNGEVWSNANSPHIIWMEKDYVVAWMRIPRHRREKT